MHSEHGDVLGFALVFLVARAFSSGSAALTGVEAITNGVPAFRKPKSRNAATTLLLLGGLSVTLIMGMIVLAQETGVQIAERPHEQLVGAPAGYHQKTLIAQIAEAVFPGFPLGLFYLIAFVTALILVLAANTAFNGFPVLGSILAQDRYLPRQLHTRGDRLAFSNGIVFLAVRGDRLRGRLPGRGHRADPALHRRRVRLVHAQPDRHDPALDPAAAHRERPDAQRSRMQRSRVINAIGCICTGAVLVIVLVTKFLAGAWIAILAMAIIFVIMKAIQRHYDRVRRSELDRRRGRHRAAQPQPRDRAGVQAAPADDARAGLRPGDPAGRARGGDRQRRRRRGPRAGREWEDSEIPVPLKVIDSPYREITRPVLDYVKRITKDSPRTWSPSSSPSTWSGTGGSRCCTTRARCGSRAGCCSAAA